MTDFANTVEIMHFSEDKINTLLKAIYVNDKKQKC
jgi:hypothetical protein